MNYWTKKFKYFNKKYWNGELSNIKVLIRDLTAEKADGLYYYPNENKKAHIEITRDLKHHHKVNILLHEMCHHAVEELYEERPYHDHGSLWKEQMRKVGFKGKIHARRGKYKVRESHE